MLLKVYKVVYSIDGRVEAKKTLTPTETERWECRVYEFFAKLNVDENLWKLENGKFTSLIPVLPDFEIEDINSLINCDVAQIAPGMRCSVWPEEAIDLTEYLNSK